jgi:hypothetical protein
MKRRTAVGALLAVTTAPLAGCVSDSEARPTARTKAASPYDFTVGANNPVKLFGFNLLPPPGDTPGIGEWDGKLNWGWCWRPSNWSKVLPPWTVQAQLAKRHNASIMRVFGGLHGVIMGAYSQAQYEANLLELVGVFRRLGLWMGLTASNGPVDMAAVPGYSRGDDHSGYKGALHSLINNVLIPNQDIIAYVEAGTQETTNVAENLALSQYFKSKTTIPALLSTSCGGSVGVNPGFRATPYVDVLSVHWYPNHGTRMEGTDLAGVAWSLSTAMRSYGQTGVQLLIEETGIHGATYQDKADWIQSLLSAAISHPDCAGVIHWGGTPDATDGGGFEIYTVSGSDLTSDYSQWNDTEASRLCATAATGTNGNLIYRVTAQADYPITATPVVLPMTAANGASVSHPSSGNFTFPITLRQRVGVRFRGSITASDPITLSLVATSSGGVTTIGTVAIPAGAKDHPVAIDGKLGVAGSISSYVLTLRAASPSRTTLAALNGSLEVGNQPMDLRSSRVLPDDRLSSLLRLSSKR